MRARKGQSPLLFLGAATLLMAAPAAAKPIKVPYVPVKESSKDAKDAKEEAKADGRDAPDADLARRFAKDLQCDSGRDAQRQFCSVARIGLDDFATPKEVTSYLGLSVQLRPDQTARQAVGEEAELTALHIGPGSARVSTVSPSDDDETQQINKVMATLSSVLKGSPGGRDVIPISADFLDFLKQERKTRGYPLQIDKRHARFSAQIPTRVYRVTQPGGQQVYVVVQADKSAPGAAFVSVYPVVRVGGT